MKMKKCPECSKAFLQPSQLQRHMRIMHPTQETKTVAQPSQIEVEGKSEGLYKCDICHKGYISHSYLLNHIEMHSDLWSYRCQNCKKAFITPSKLKRHWEACSYSFEFVSTGDVSNTSVQENINLAERSVELGEVGNSSRSDPCENRRPESVMKVEKSGIEQGLENILQEVESFSGVLVNKVEGDTTVESVVAGEDEKMDGSSSILTNRGNAVLTSDLNQNYHCKLCNITIMKRCSYLRHMKSHKYRWTNECSHCRERFRSVETLRSHIQKKHLIRNYVKCEICHKFTAEDNLATHVARHSKETYGKCFVCSKVFERRDLSPHVRQEHGKEMGDVSLALGKVETARVSEGLVS